MKTTVCATLLILGALECSGQYIYPVVQRLYQYQPLLTFQQPHSQNYYPLQERPSANGVAGNVAAHNPSAVPWNTPDSKIPEPTQTPWTQTSRWTRPQNNPVQESATPSRWLTSRRTPAWPVPPPKPKRQKTSTTPRTQPEQYAVPTSPPSSGEKLVFPPPGGNAAGSTFNSLAVANDDNVADSAMDINSGLRQFALEILMDMTEASPDKNVVLSPYSIWAVMLVIYEGAEGQTARQIATTLHFKDRKEKVRLNYRRLEAALTQAGNESHSDFVSGNGIFHDKNRPPKPEFERLASSHYQCQLRPVDFFNPSSAVKTINDWVSEVTRKRIRTLVKTEDIGQPELIITNALFFKGQWKIPFNLSATHTDKFYNENKEHIADVRMMYQKGAYMYSFISEIGAHVLDMPYEDAKFRMLVVLPKPTSTVSEVLRLMKQFPVDLCYDRLVREQEMFAEDEVHVYLPRFKFGNRVQLKSNLQRLGIRDVFESGVANLSAMSSLQLYLGKVFHVSEIEVTEEGTVASAATAGGFVNKMGPPKFLANRPFAYFIVESSQKTVIFAGKVADPNKKMS